MNNLDVSIPNALAPTDTAQPMKRGRGRPKGSRNKVSKMAQSFFQRLWNNPDFRKKFKKDWIAGKVPPPLMVAAAHYAFGKPVDQVNLNTDPQQGPTAFVLIVDGRPLVPHAGGADDD